MNRPALRILRLGRVGSTQDEARVWLARGCGSGTAIVAEEQTRGRGRRGRRWESAAGLGIWMTYLHRSGRPARDWPAVTSVGALSLCLALEAIGLRPAAKWPNDILLSGRKVAGVLADLEDGVVLLGIGINLFHQEADFPVSLRARSTSIALEKHRSRSDLPFDRESFLIELLDRMRDRLEQFEADGPKEIVEEIWQRTSLRDQRITVLLPSGVCHRGNPVGLGETGALCLQTEEGKVTIPSGTVIVEEDA